MRTKLLRRGLTWALVVGVIAALVAVTLREEPVAVETRRVTRGDLEVALRDEGRTRVQARHVVSAPLDGFLHRVTLEPGDDVRAGVTVLARVEPLGPALLDERATALAEARVASAAAAAAATREREAAARALLGAAEEDLERRRRGGDAVSAQALADARREVLFHAGEVASAHAGVAVAEADLAVARAALVAACRPEGSDDAALVLYAPIDGQVLAVVRESEGPVRMGEPLLELADVQDLEVVADFLTTDAVRMTAGMPARAVDFGGEGELALRVRRVEPAARTKVSALGVEEQRVDVVLDLVDPRAAELALGDGFRVQVEVLVSRAEGVLLVPEAALVRAGESWAVYALVGSRAVSTPVEVGRRDGRAAELLGGLAHDAEVIVFPSDRVTDGARVERR